MSAQDIATIQAATARAEAKRDALELMIQASRLLRKAAGILERCEAYKPAAVKLCAACAILEELEDPADA